MILVMDSPCKGEEIKSRLFWSFSFSYANHFITVVMESLHVPQSILVDAACFYLFSVITLCFVFQSLINQINNVFVSTLSLCTLLHSNDDVILVAILVVENQNRLSTNATLVSMLNGLPLGLKM